MDWLPPRLLVVMCVALGCGSRAASEDEPDAPAPDEPPPVMYACESRDPLLAGDATWSAPPFTPPGNDGEGDGGDGGDDGDDDGGSGGAPPSGFITMSDGGGGVSFECDLFAQDCNRGEKCMPWANDGGPQWNATRCSPLDPNPGVPGDPCQVEGSGVSGLDDCDIGSMCWDVDRDGAGTCVGFCYGSAEAPICDSGHWCYQGNDGALALCLEDALCEADGVCQCMCTADPDCEPERCMGMQQQAEETIVAPPVPHYDELERGYCPETTEPIELYMSSDDSNSQASPILARRTIREGRLVPHHVIRIHEFVNYYDFGGDHPEDAAAALGLEMRRTHAERGEFALMLYARGHKLAAADRPPIDLVFSIDTSGSMAGEPLQLAKEAIVATSLALRAGDVVSVVEWSNGQSVPLAGHVITGPGDPVLIDTVTALDSGGSTDLHGGLVRAYALADQHRVDGGIARVMLLSDGGANLGITSADLIGSAAAGGDLSGIYLVGVGVGSSTGYSDGLMDAATDAGRGAYMFIDGSGEAYKQLTDRFIQNVAVAADSVQMKVTLPWYFGVRAYHGEQISSDPKEVRPQHLAPNDVMAAHSIIAACKPSYITECDAITAKLTYAEPLTGEVVSEEVVMALRDAVDTDDHRLHKADAVIGWAKALIVIGWLVEHGEADQALEVATAMSTWLEAAAADLDDPELLELSGLATEYAGLLEAL